VGSSDAEWTWWEAKAFLVLEEGAEQLLVRRFGDNLRLSY
jgi:hypothetical protein